MTNRPPRKQRKALKSGGAPKENLKPLGALIRRIRKDRKLTQLELATLSGVGINFVSQIENGKATAQMGKVLDVAKVIGLEFHISPGSRGLVVL